MSAAFSSPWDVTPGEPEPHLARDALSAAPPSRLVIDVRPARLQRTIGQRLALAAAFAAAALVACRTPAPAATRQGGSDQSAPEARSPRAIADAVLLALARGDVGAAASRFGPELARALPPARLVAALGELSSAAGPLRRFVHRGETRLGETVVVAYDVAFERRPMVATIAVRPDGTVAGVHFRARALDEPAATSVSYRELPFELGAGMEQLSGLLTLPSGRGTAALAVLLPGSGPHSADGPEGGPPVLRWLARALAERGVATARFAKRRPPDAGTGWTVEDELVRDGAIALGVLRASVGAADAPAFVVGHSLGAWIAPEVARRSPPVAGLVLLAPAGRPLTRVVADQLARQGALDDALAAQLRAIEVGTAAPELMVLGAPASYWIDALRRDEPRVARELGVPVLLVRGAADVQIVREDIQAWRDALAPGQARTAELEGMDHLLVGSGGTLAPALVEEISAFVGATSSRAPPPP